MPVPVPTLPQIAALARDVCSWANRIQVERVTEGVSTYVFRLACDGSLFYVRVLPGEGDTFAPEVYVHTALRARGVGAPEVIYYAALHEELQGSVMVVTAIHGQALGYGSHPWDEHELLVAAGRDLAIL